jgi:hypothetical protein
VRRLALLLATGVAALAAATPATAAPPLPVLHVTTSGPVRDDPKVGGTLTVRRAGRVTFTTRIGIEVRGHSSRTFPKKQYALETRDARGKDRDVSLLGLPRESDWVLSAPYSDKTLMRNVLAYRAARALGRYASRTVYVELVLNGRYDGVYVLAERPKLGAGRVAAARTDVSGGYLLELTLGQKLRAGDTWFQTPVTRRAIAVTGAGGREAEVRRSWITAHVASFEHVLYGRDFRAAEDGWRRYLDAAAAVDYVLLQELFKNQDAFLSSTFAHKPSGEKLVLGPLWDFDVALGNSNYGRSATVSGWLLTPRAARAWASRLYDDPRFLDALERRWREVRQQGLVEGLLRQVDADATRLRAAQRRNFARWPILGRYVWPNPVDPATGHLRRTYAAEVAYLKTWLRTRAAWLDANVGSLGREWGTR